MLKVVMISPLPPQKTGESAYTKTLIERLNDKLAPVRARRADLASHPDTVRDVLHQGADQARVRARETMGQVRAAMHLA